MRRKRGGGFRPQRREDAQDVMTDWTWGAKSPEDGSHASARVPERVSVHTLQGSLVLKPETGNTVLKMMKLGLPCWRSG